MQWNVPCIPGSGSSDYEPVQKVKIKNQIPTLWGPERPVKDIIMRSFSLMPFIFPVLGVRVTGPSSCRLGHKQPQGYLLGSHTLSKGFPPKIG